MKRTSLGLEELDASFDLVCVSVEGRSAECLVSRGQMRLGSFEHETEEPIRSAFV